MNAPAEDGEGAAAIAAAVQLPYAFARRFGVIEAAPETSSKSCAAAVLSVP